LKKIEYNFEKKLFLTPKKGYSTINNSTSLKRQSYNDEGISVKK